MRESERSLYQKPVIRTLHDPRPLPHEVISKIAYDDALELLGQALRCDVRVSVGGREIKTVTNTSDYEEFTHSGYRVYVISAGPQKGGRYSRFYSGPTHSINNRAGVSFSDYSGFILQGV